MDDFAERAFENWAQDNLPPTLYESEPRIQMTFDGHDYDLRVLIGEAYRAGFDTGQEDILEQLPTRR